jgi:hypothetical protein
MLPPEPAAFLPNLSKIFIRSHQYGDIQKGIVEDCPAVVLEDMRFTAQEFGATRAGTAEQSRFGGCFHPEIYLLRDVLSLEG